MIYGPMGQPELAREVNGGEVVALGLLEVLGKFRSGRRIYIHLIGQSPKEREAVQRTQIIDLNCLCH